MTGSCLRCPPKTPCRSAAASPPRDVSARRLVLLQEGHCLRDQALAYCDGRNNTDTGLGATSLATVMQLVAGGYGVTLLPEVAIDVEVRDERVKLLRFVEPQPQRRIGLAWRPTSPRKAELLAFGRMVVEALEIGRSKKRPCATAKR